MKMSTGKPSKRSWKSLKTSLASTLGGSDRRQYGSSKGEQQPQQEGIEATLDGPQEQPAEEQNEKWGKVLRQFSSLLEVISEEVPDHVKLRPNIFSFFLSAHPGSLPFMTALFIFVVKIVIFSLILFDLGTRGDSIDNNRFGINPLVTFPVMVAQFFAFSIAIITQNDLISFLTTLRNGFPKHEMEDTFPKTNAELEEIFKKTDGDELQQDQQQQQQDPSSNNNNNNSQSSSSSATSTGQENTNNNSNLVDNDKDNNDDHDEKVTCLTCCNSWFRGVKGQWVWMLTCNFLCFCFWLMSTFLLIVTSTTVLDVLLNFAAVSFVSEFDDMAFVASEQGFLGKYNKNQAEYVGVVATYTRGRRTMDRLILANVVWGEFVGLVSARCTMILGLALAFLGVLACWFVVIFRQLNGHYVVQSVIVQIGDEVQPLLSTYSGIYNLHIKKYTVKHEGRQFYVQENGGDGRIGYCTNEKRWAFFLRGGEPCDSDEALVTSSDSSPFDIAEATGWSVKLKKSSVRVAMEDFYVAPGCESNDDCGGGARGSCVENKCHCEGEYFGKTCDFSKSEVCPTLKLDELYANNFPTRRTITTEFELVPDVVLNHRSVFYNQSTEDIIFYTGLRWALTTLDDTRTTTTTIDDFLVSIAQHKWDFYIDMLSEPVHYHTAQDHLSSTPADLHWFPLRNRATLANARLEDSDKVSLLCAVCDNDENLCENGNEGNCIDGTCECMDGTSGTLCQLVSSE